MTPDEWFAQAEDVLTDWRPGGDAMHARPPADDGEALPVRADSYYDQGDGYSWRRGMRLADEAAAHARTVAELERLRSTVLVGPGSGWVVEIRDGVGRWRNLTDRTPSPCGHAYVPAPGSQMCAVCDHIRERSDD